MTREAIGFIASWGLPATPSTHPGRIKSRQGLVFRFRKQTMNTITFDQLIRREFTHDGFGSIKLVERTERDYLHGQAVRHILRRQEQGADRDWCGIADWTKAALIDFAHSMPGLQSAKPLKVVFLHQWFTEVRTQTPPAPQALQERLQFVADTRFLPVGPGEQIALFFQYASGSQGVHIYRCDDHGNAVCVHGYWPEAVERWAAEPQQSVASLNERQTNEAIERQRGDMLYRMAAGVSDFDVAIMRRQLDLLEQHQAVAQPERTASGAVIRRSHIDSGSVDSIARHTRSADGWVRYATGEDAWYFGVFVNAHKRETMTYAEGDVTHVVCDSHEQFMSELKDMAEFYSRNRKPAAVGYDATSRTCFYDVLHFLGCEAKEAKLLPVVTTTTGSVPLFVAINTQHAALQGLALGQEVDLPADAYQLDLYNPLAFEPSEGRAMLTAEGFDIEVKIAGQVHTAALDLRQTEKEALA